jgi:hypothetical protein
MDVEVIWVKSEPEYFCEKGLDTDLLFRPSGTNSVGANEIFNTAVITRACG